MIVDQKVDYSYTDYENIWKDFTKSQYGYWILPNGNLLGLNSAMQHGLIAAHFDARVLEELDKHLADSDETYGLNLDTKNSTQCDFIACYQLGWIRISFSGFDGSFNFAWSRTIQATLNQLEIVSFICDMYDPNREEIYWWEDGIGSYKQMMADLKAVTAV